MDAGRLVSESLDLGQIRDNLKIAWYSVIREPLTVGDVERLDGLLSQAEAHRRRIALREPAGRRRPQPAPEEPPMSEPFDLDAAARRMLAEVERRYGVAPREPEPAASLEPRDPPAAAAPAAPRPAPRPVEPLVRTPPAWMKTIAEPPSDFRARVARRRLELEAGIIQTDQTAPKTPPEK
jgi:hypothetical protein